MVSRYMRVRVEGWSTQCHSGSSGSPTVGPICGWGVTSASMTPTLLSSKGISLACSSPQPSSLEEASWGVEAHHTHWSLYHNPRHDPISEFSWVNHGGSILCWVLNPLCTSSSVGRVGMYTSFIMFPLEGAISLKAWKPERPAQSKFPPEFRFWKFRVWREFIRGRVKEGSLISGNDSSISSLNWDEDDEDELWL